MKIIIATGIFQPDIGGPATYASKLASSLVQEGNLVKLITYSDKKEDDSRYDFKVCRVLRNNILPFRYFLYFLCLFFLSFGAKTIYAQGPVGSGLPSSWVAKILRKKFVLKITGDYAWEQGQNRYGVKDSIDQFQNKKYSSQVERLRKTQQKVAQKANTIIVPSYYLKKIVVNWGIDENKIKVIYNAVDDVIIDSISKEKAKQLIGIKGDIIISVGRLVPWKGFEAMIDMMPNLLEKNANFKLAIIGDGPQYNNLLSKIKNQNLDNNIVLVGAVDAQRLKTYLAASDMFVLNTSYEGLPHMVIEAQQMNLPVITTNVCGNPEVVKNNYNGLLVEFDNKKELIGAILRLWQSNSLRQRLVDNASNSLKKFGLKQMINQTLEVLKK